MVDVVKLGKYLNDKDMTISDFWLLYNIMVQEINIKEGKYRISALNFDEDITTAGRYFQIYLERTAYINGKPSETLTQLRDLERRGYVEIWSKDPNSVSISDMRVTDLFRDDFFIKDGHKAFMDFVKLYPDKVYVNNKKQPTFNKGLDEIEKVFWDKICKGGDKLAYERFMMITSIYLDDNKYNNTNGAGCNALNYFERFEGVAMMYETAGVKQNKHSGGRRAI